jgi:hypothetical protein
MANLELLIFYLFIILFEQGQAGEDRCGDIGAWGTWKMNTAFNFFNQG